MKPSEHRASKSFGVLDAHERSAEVLFGLIMVLSFTGSLSAATASREDVRTMLIGALGCNLAWGIVDGVMYLLALLAERGRSLALVRQMRAAQDVAAARPLVADALPEGLDRLVRPGELDALIERVRALPEPGGRARLGRRDFLGALGILLLVFFSTLPVALPFLLVSDTWRAMRWSNGVALAMLFAMGYLQGKFAGLRPIVSGLAMAALGVVLVGMTIALGG
jgi:VIT1/CCC1 family predicted Fe2+/Mn2+ transporter